ncbi:MAG: 2-amino-4-hydroxy-6-hydroxymethyldihydropteridine diphosphokinase [Burkholderiaceae bacterium]|nr:2-amino-4-hydroxy-6-hydroxymethyldihydropteridine diphosphokinase [Burkholderiaceae bacterium]
MSAAAGATAYIGIGANLGEARATVAAAIAELARRPGCRLLAASSVWRSAPVDAQGPDFFNAVAAIETTLAPEALLAVLQALEQAFGRQRPYRHAPRTLDLDLLLHGDALRSTPQLTLPHPRLHQRAFVLRPLLEIAPDLAAPGLGALADWLPACADQALEKLG